MKKHIVRFRITEDGGGQWGLISDIVWDSHKRDKFNAAWDPRFIMHDIFEHSFEFQKPFIRFNAIEPCGEVAATGACWYYLNVLQPSSLCSFFYRQYNNVDHIIGASMTSVFMDATCESMLALPYQRCDDDFESVVDSLLKHFPKMKWLESPTPQSYARSVTRTKLKRLLQWGYNHARRFIGDTIANRIIYDEIHDFFELLTTTFHAEDWAGYSYLVFEMKTNKGDIKDWNVSLETFKYYPAHYLMKKDVINFELPYEG